MGMVVNINELPREYTDDPDFQTRIKTLLIGDAAGSEKLYVNIDFVKPGSVSTKYHAHSQQEEFFLIMSGSGILRLNGKEIPVKTGDAVSKPAGKGSAHQFINNTSEVLQILDIGTREKDDIVTYPDEGTLYVKNRKLVFHLGDHIEDWVSEPDQV
ncbi:MAG: cupin domain-containing protein [Clostridia bacterium]|nr:cupin domain-containing protein [Clostridia bacterium]MDR3644981.1 cupin domain-containing protein [Clostridia bacterium]